MDDLDLSNAPNPFSIFANDRRRSRKKLTSAASFLAFVIALMLIVGFGQGYWQRIHIADLLDGFSTQSTTQKVERLKQLQQYDAAALSGLTSALADTQPEVSEFAFTTLSDTRRSWATLPEPIASTRRSELAGLLEDVSSKLPLKPVSENDRRRERINQLAQSITQDELASTVPNQAIVQSAMNVVSNVGNPEIVMNGRAPLVSQPERSSETTTVQPLPLDSLTEHWSDWPPGPDSLPRLYKQSYAALGQVDTNTHDKAQPQLLRPMAHSAADSLPTEFAVSIVEDYDQLDDRPSVPEAYWTRQLASRNFRVRLRAVHELQNIYEINGAQSIRQTLTQHLDNERDEKVITRLRSVLSSLTAAR